MKTSIDWSATADHRTALHEAAHLVVARALGLACGGVALVSDGSRVGYAEIDPPWLGWHRGLGRKAPIIEAYIVATQAGAEAEIAFLGGCDGGDWSDREDIREAYRHVRVKGRVYIGDDIELAHEARLREKSRRLVRQHREAIARLALALIDRRRLNNSEVTQALRL